MLHAPRASPCAFRSLEESLAMDGPSGPHQGSGHLHRPHASSAARPAVRAAPSPPLAASAAVLLVVEMGVEERVELLAHVLLLLVLLLLLLLPRPLALLGGGEQDGGLLELEQAAGRHGS